jgi:glyoxylase-like metal-dependent hydrolase (beta-lactamase superfamily II)
MSQSDFSLLVRGVPAHALHHGALGWCSIGLIRVGDRVCLIDTGGFGYRGLLLDALNSEGLSPDEVTDVLITHSHWDHLTNVDLFPNAVVRMSEGELEWSLSLRENHLLVPVAVVKSAMTQGRITAFAPGQEVCPGVVALPTPGHTPGHTSFLIKTKTGLAVFAGDAVKNEVELVTRRARMTMDGAESARSIEKIVEIAQNESALIYCGHDRTFRWERGSFVPGERHPAAVGGVELGGDCSEQADRQVDIFGVRGE